MSERVISEHNSAHMLSVALLLEVNLPVAVALLRSDFPALPHASLMASPAPALVPTQAQISVAVCYGPQQDWLKRWS